MRARPPMPPAGARPAARLRARAHLALVLSSGAAAPAAGAAAGEQTGGGFSAAPAVGEPQDVHGTYFTLKTAKGASREQSLVVRNQSDQPKHLLVNAVDGLTGSTSGTVYANRDQLTHRAGGWVTTAVRSIDLAPHSAARVRFTVHVPTTARPGDHLAGLAIQDSHRSKAESRFAVTEIVRVVVGVQIVVPGQTERRLALGKLALQPLPGTKVPSVSVGLSNPGTLLCKPVLNVSLRRAGAAKAQQLVRPLDTVLPGTSIAYAVPWNRSLEAGSYDVAVRAEGCGKSVRASATTRLGAALHGTPAAPDALAPATVVVKDSAVPLWASIGGAGGALVLGILATLFVQRRRLGGRRAA